MSYWRELPGGEIVPIPEDEYVEDVRREIAGERTRVVAQERIAEQLVSTVFLADGPAIHSHPLPFETMIFPDGAYDPRVPWARNDRIWQWRYATRAAALPRSRSRAPSACSPAAARLRPRART